MSELRSIGAVVSELQQEFPDLTASKVRYLESEGLIEPLRTSRGSRRYAVADVDRLRRILRLQRDEFLPLSVIRDRLGQLEDATTSSSVPAERLRPPRPRAMSAAEVAQRGGVDASTLEELVDHGLITTMDATAVEICRLVDHLSAFGIGARHLRSFRVAADREVGLVQQALAPRRGSSSAVEESQRRSELLALLLDLHLALLRHRASSLAA